MRRQEFSMAEEREEVERFLEEMTFGFLGTAGEDGFPHIKPINYVFHKGSFYIHGSKIGQKMTDIRQDERVSFAVAKEYAIIPSYFSDPKFACPATSFFKSVYITGRATVLEDIAEKAEALEAFMRKLQPEGGYDPITQEDEAYVPRIRGVAVMKIEVESMNAKFKFGQNQPQAKMETIAAALEQRGRELDPETAELMRKYCPHHANTPAE
ncbi:pyridoxamine 5'-phosphate oxidase family protein [Paenibacillus sp. MBLB4367]|uniref:pyridoxamine 5'-phosphate oxidase family protein n=1 Tax=Paenibacillus sp. MBLB4367 TaxID=3384767 RepID=UPI003907EB0C